jgi:hypothetical protein
MQSSGFSPREQPITVTQFESPTVRLTDLEIRFEGYRLHETHPHDAGCVARQ